MLRHKPQFSYCGLTLVLSNPSRFDNIKLLSAGGGRLIDESLRPHFNRYQCDIRLKESLSVEPLLPGTRCILTLGESAMRYVTRVEDNSLGEIRGSVFNFQDIPVIPTFFPQDAADVVNHEKEFNPQNDIYSQDFDSPDSDNVIGEKRRHGLTERRNYRFWISKDIEKCKQIIQRNGLIPKRSFDPEYVIYPKSEEIIQTLTKTKGKFLYLDLETFVPSCDLKCIGISFGMDSPIYVIPIFLHDCSWAYSNLPNILHSLAIGMRDNCTVAHNGASFDFFILAWKYRIPLGKLCYDTMIAQHRCYPEVEKSLGHCTSLWTFESFHKDEGGTGYSTYEQAKATWQYCGKDVYTMILIHEAITTYAKTIPGLTESIDMAMKAIRPYLIISLMGIRYDDNIRLKTLNENDRMMMQYLRLLNYLVGEHNLKMIAGKSKSSMPTSNKQCCTYFHEMLEYPVVAYGKQKQDGKKNPSLAKKAMLKLKLKHHNPVIDLCLSYRELAKESSTLNFIPWRQDEKHDTHVQSSS